MQNFKTKIIIFFTSVLVFLIIGILLFTFSKFNTNSTTNSDTSSTDSPILNDPVETPISYLTTTQKLALEVSALKSVPKASQPITSLKNTGWLPDWDLPNGLETLKKYSENFYSVSPFWMIPQEDGHIKEVLNKVNPDIIEFTKNNNILLIPTVSLFDADLFSKIFNKAEYYNNFITDVLSKVDKYEYGGIDLDFEEIKSEDKEIFFSILKDLKRKLAERNKILVFTVLPKWSDVINYIGHPQTRSVQNYKQISDIVDEFRIMTYDFYGRDSDEAGPVAPLEWMERVLQYAIFSGVPREKIVMGVPTYAYDWSDRRISEVIDLATDYTGLGSLFGLEPGDAYYHTGVEKVMANYNLDYDFNEVWGEAIGRYDYNGESRIVVFPTDKSIEVRKKLAAEYGIKGIAFWKLGSEGNLKL